MKTLAELKQMSFIPHHDCGCCGEMVGWYPTMKKHIDHIMYELRQDAKAFVIMLVVVMTAAAVIVGTM